MKLTVICTTLVCLSMGNLWAQKGGFNPSKKAFRNTTDVGVTIAANQQRSDINNLYIIDFSSVRYGFGGFIRNTFHKHLAITASASYYRLEGADRFVREKSPGTNGYFRYIRNLSFRTELLELALSLEMHMLPYIPYNKQYNRWTPYGSVGWGVVWFQPKALYNGQWERLQPLGTEGQGRPGYDDPYSRYAWAAPLRVGIKYNINSYLVVQGYAGYTFVGTDYLDDVSTVYANPTDLDPLTADIAMRADEVAPVEEYGRITAAGEQRGDPGDKDGFWTIGGTLTFRLGRTYSEQTCASWRAQKSKNKR